jgi:hypothetical protein
MIKNDDSVIVPERPAKADDTACRNSDCCPPPRPETDPSRTYTAVVDGAQTFENLCIDWKRIGERRLWQRARGGEWPRRRRIFIREQARGLEGRSAARLLASELLDMLCRRNRDITGAKCLSARGERLLERTLLKLGELPAAVRQLLVTSNELGTCKTRRRLEALSFCKLGRERFRPLLDDRQGGIEEHSNLDELVGSSTVYDRKERWSVGHDSQSRKKGGHRPLLPCKPFAMRGDIGRRHSELCVSRCDARLGGLDRLGSRCLFRLKALGFSTSARNGSFKPRGLCHCRGLLGSRLDECLVKRPGLRLCKRAGGGQ